MSWGELSALFGNPDERDNSKASRVSSIFERDISGGGAKFSLDTDEVLWKGLSDPNRIQLDSSSSYCILDRVAWGWLLEVEMLRSTS